MLELYDLVGVNDLRFSPFCWRTKAVLTDLEATIFGQDYFFGLPAYADLCLFGSLKWVTVVSKEPLFDSAPALRGWWERIQSRIEGAVQ